MNRKQRKRKLERARAHNGSVQLSKRDHVLAMLGTMTKPELLDYAEHNGIIVAKRWSKSLIIDAIKSALAGKGHP